MRRIMPGVCLILICTEVCIADLVWNAGGDGINPFDEQNWVDTETGLAPPSGTIDLGVAVQRNMLVGGNSQVGGSSGIASTFLLGAGFTIELTDSAQWRQSGLIGSDGSEQLILRNQSKVFFDFIDATTINLIDNSAATLDDAVAPLGSLTTVNLSSPEAKVIFPNRTVSEFLNEQLGQFSVAGQPAAQATNLIVFRAVVDGQIATVVEAIESPVIFGDVNEDGVADLLDVAPFVTAVTSNNYAPGADINLNGANDLLDVAGFVNIILAQ